MILSTRKMIASIDRYNADPSTDEIYYVLFERVGPEDTRERLEQYLHDLMRLPRDVLSRKMRIAEARKMVAEKARQAAGSPRGGTLVKADAGKVKSK